MTSNFALSLSFEGIRLMHRVPGGWHHVGEVALDCADLAAELSDLREKGLLLEPGGLRTKLLIPDSQIKYVTIDSAQTTDDDVHAALEGATPYALNDLVIDYDRTGGRTYIAAVARETLDEAEAFAADHAFAPIAFAAVPEPLTFRKEVFFGATKGADKITGGAVIVADDDAVNVIGDAVFDAVNSGPRIPGFMAAGTKPINDGAPEETPDVVFASRGRGEDAETPNDPPQFSRRTEPPQLAVPTGIVDGPAIETAPNETPPAPKPIVAEALESPAAPKIIGQPEVDPAPSFASRRTPEIVVPTPTADPVAPPPPRDPPAAAPVKPAPFEPVKKGGVGGKPRFLGLMLTAGLLLFLFLVALWANTLSEDGIAGWFSGGTDTDMAQQDDSDANTVALAPAIETLPLIEETPAPSALAPETARPETAETPQPLPIVRAPTGRVLSPAEADRIYAATGVYQRAPRLPLIPREATLEGFIESNPLPLSARLDQLRMPARDPMLPDPAIAPLRNPPAPGVVFPRDLRGFILATPEGTLTPDGVLIYAGAPEIEPPSRPGSEVIVAPAPAVVTQVPTTQEAESDVILVAGRPPLVPPLRPENLAPVEVPPQDDAAVLPETATDPALPEIANDTGGDELALTTEDVVVVAGQPALTPPIRPILPAQDDALVEVFSTAGVVVNPVGLTTPGGTQLASFRPPTRPAGARLPDPAPIIQADPALAGYRPALRPEGLVTEQLETPDETEEPDLTAIIAAIAEAAPPSAFENVTTRAIAASPRPDPRPRNFAQVVAQAQAAIARRQPSPSQEQPATVAVTRSAPATPSGPIPGSVAQAATIDNAIRLRDMNLIGVYGRPNARRALVRLGNGRYVKVEVGSSLDGGRVTAIGDSALNFVKRGQTYALQLPQG